MVTEDNGKINGTNRERDERGRFLPGNGGGPGRPPGPTTADLKAAIRGSTSKQDIVDIWRKAVEQAKKGNDPARRFVFQGLGLIEILVDVTSAGEKIDSSDGERIGRLAAILDAIRAHESGAGYPGVGPGLAAGPASE